MEKCRDPSVNAAHQAIDIWAAVGGPAKQRDCGHRSLNQIDLQQKQKEQDHQRRKPKQSPKDFSGECFAKSVADQRDGRDQRVPHFSTVRTKTSSSVLVVGTRASTSQCCARTRSRASFTSSRVAN